MKIPLCSTAFLFALLFAITAHAETWQLASPDGRVQFEIERSGKGLPRYSVKYDGNPVISPSPMGLNSSLSLSEFSAPKVTRRSVDEVYHMVLGKASAAPDRYHEMTLSFPSANQGSAIDIIFRAYDAGAAFRYILPPQPGLGEYTIYEEGTGFSFPVDYSCWGANLGNFYGAHEPEFDPIDASKIRRYANYDSPLVCKTGHGETTFALAESDVENYPGTYYTRYRNNDLGVTTRLAPRLEAYPLRSYAVKMTEPDNPLRTPWRVIMLGESPRALVESTLVETLGAPSRIADTSWIRGGKVTWEGINNWNAPVANPGRNNETYFAYIDFAHELGLEYLLIDEKWYENAYDVANGDVLKPIADLDMPRILAYAKAHNVSVLLWLHWEQLDKQMDEALATYAQWGVAGLKVDFMDRNDQEMVNWYHTLLSKAAEHRLLIDMHGAYLPNGLIRTYPNMITQEGVLGSEDNIVSTRVTASHNVTLPFTRMILGPMDYCPGLFIHRTPEDFYYRRDFPMTMTTRGQAIAMYVVYDSPLMMVSDAPQIYRKADGSWEDGVDFIRDVPTTWDETRVLQGDIGEYIVTARRKGDTWYLGAMTNEDGRMIDLPLDFLAEGAYEAKIWQDGASISSLDMSTRRVDRNARLQLKLAPTGGGTAVFRPVQG